METQKIINYLSNSGNEESKFATSFFLLQVLAIILMHLF